MSSHVPASSSLRAGSASQEEWLEHASQKPPAQAHPGLLWHKDTGQRPCKLGSVHEQTPVFPHRKFKQILFVPI